MKKYDVGIVGESLLAPFIAGLLKKNHQKKTCLFLSRRVQHQIVRKINLSFDTITRPESWEMLNCAVKETFPTLAKVGSNAAVGKTNALVLSHTQSGANLLSHMYHYLHGMDVQVERLADDDFPHVRAAYRARGIRFIRPSVLWPAVFDWLKKLGVDIIEPD
ncbi:MAG: hypothetical protein L3J13_07935, partial [Devosiaceae bacterium]|nr:hypothetical protein [Devosiaceae bacterium]